HLDLHSFPTRRSSDLGRSRIRAIEIHRSGYLSGRAGGPHRRIWKWKDASPSLACFAGTKCQWRLLLPIQETGRRRDCLLSDLGRSEEHTSELQSLAYL